MAYTKYHGTIFYLGDSVPGDNKDNEGKLFSVKSEEFDNEAVFVLREVKQYISSMKPEIGSKLLFYFRKDVSPRFGNVWLLEAYGTSDSSLTWCEGRRLLIHRGNKPSGSLGCWLIGKETSSTFKCTDNSGEPTVVDSVKTLGRVFNEKPDKIVFELEYAHASRRD